MEKNSDLLKFDLVKIKNELQSLKEEVQANAIKEDIYLLKVEDYCNSIRNAITGCSLKLPDISSFEFYLPKLKEQANIEYILGLLHNCWRLTHPDTMFNALLKDEDPTKMLDKSLSKYTGDCSNQYNAPYNIVSEELNTPINITTASFYYRKAQKNEMLNFFREYIKELHKRTKRIYEKWGLTVSDTFIPVRCLEVELSKEQLLSLFNAIASKGFMSNDEDTKHIFLSLFSNTMHTADKKIIWNDINKKNKQPSIASLYTMFSAMGIDMNSHNKTIICRLFNDANNKPILPEKLKPRNDSDTLHTIRTIVEKIRSN